MAEYAGSSSLIDVRVAAIGQDTLAERQPDEITIPSRVSHKR